MFYSREWTTEEWEIARALAIQIPLVTFDQASRGWFPEPHQALASITRLKSAGLIESQIAEAIPVYSLSRPLLSWAPGSPAPNRDRWAAIAERAAQRRHGDTIRIELYVASSKGMQMFGAFRHSGDFRACEVQHNLQLAEVFVRYLRSRPRQARLWLGEAAFPKLGFDIRGMKDPDAFIIRNGGCARHVVEYVGNYPVEHLEAFHAHCSSLATQRLAAFTKAAGHSHLAQLYSPRGTGYELW